MFKWLKKSNSLSIATNTVEKLPVKKLIRQIQLLTGVTKADFQSLYFSVIERRVEPATQAEDETELILQLNKAITALKRRRGYLLPLGADSETVFREQEEWTYAVFTAALLQSFKIEERMKMAKKLLPTNGFAWLQRNGTLFKVWQSYLLEECPAVLTEIITGNKNFNDSPSIQNNEAEEAKNFPVVEMAEEAFINTDIPNKTSTSRARMNTTTVVKELLDISADGFWQWLKQAIILQQIVLNQTHSIVHGVEAGILICMPQAVDAFLSQAIGAVSAENSKLISSHRYELMKTLKKNEALARTVKGARLHSYCVGKWQARNVISGIVVPKLFLLSADIPISINPNLMPDPMADA